MSARSGSRTVPLGLPMTQEIAAFERVLRFLWRSRRAREPLNFTKRDLLWADAVAAIRERVAVLKTQRDRVSRTDLAGLARAKGAL